MSGSKANIASKFDVDRLDLDRLRDMAAVRKDTPYFGRGLRFDANLMHTILLAVNLHEQSPACTVTNNIIQHCF